MLDSVPVPAPVPTPVPVAEPLRVFVYGTLKPGEQYYSVYCEGNVTQAEAAIVPGQLYDLPLGYPALTVGAGWVQGVLLTFSQVDILSRLDDLEDYDPHRSREENLYDRCWLEVFSPQQVSLGYAWIYVMSLQRVQRLQGKLLPQGWWSAASSGFLPRI